MRIITSLLGTCLLSILFVSNASGQIQRTFVSGGGSDSNPCSRAAPCRTFTQAMSKTSGGGEVIVLDSAGYGAFSITQAVSIIAPPGVYAGVTVFSGDGIDINAGVSDTVILRGLTVNNQGSTGSGIVFNTGNTLRVEGCVVNGFSSVLTSGVACGASATLEVRDSTFSGNGVGIQVAPASGSAIATIDQVRIEGNGLGLRAHDNSKVTVRNSVASHNGNALLAYSESSATAELNIENCVASNNTTGIAAVSVSTGVATVRVSNSTVTNNGTGVLNDGSPAVLLSRGNNTVEGNAVDTSGTIGSYTAK